MSDEQVTENPEESAAIGNTEDATPPDAVSNEEVEESGEDSGESAGDTSITADPTTAASTGDEASAEASAGAGDEVADDPYAPSPEPSHGVAPAHTVLEDTPAEE